MSFAEILRAARKQAKESQDLGNREVGGEFCEICNWKFGPKHRYTGGPSCQVLIAQTKFSDGEWARVPTKGFGLREFIKKWPESFIGPIGFGPASQYGLGIRKGRIMMPIVEGETAAITLARVQLLAFNEKMRLNDALEEVIRKG